MGPFTPQTQDITVYTLAAQLMADAANDGDRARIDRAIDLVGGVERLANGQWSVASSTGQSGYRVNHDMRRSCNCPDYQQRGRTCKHGYAAILFQQAERADAEQSDPTPDDPDVYYCVLCEEPIPAAEVVETRWGFMHERCAASEPHEADEDARYELTGRGYLALVPAAALPPAEGGCTRLPMSARARAFYSELYDDEPQGVA